MRTLVLWDLDHTLVDVGPVSREAFAAAFHAATGTPLVRLADLAGRTDRAIMAETLKLHDLAPSEDALVAFADALTAAFDSRNATVRRNGRVLPGARAVLNTLADESGVVQSVLTGNMKPVAVGKLTALELDGFLMVEVGAYGMDAARRSDLVRVARERAAALYGHRFDGPSTVLIGDTPHDVAAGRETGSRVIGVATGSSDQEALTKAGADTVLADLTDTELLLRAVRTFV